MARQYFIIQENNESQAYAFTTLVKGYKPEPRKTQREQYTPTGKLDVQVGPNENQWRYTVKVKKNESDTFDVTPGSIMTASTVKWGDKGDLELLFSRVIPPSNKFRFRDVDGSEYWVYFTGSLRPKAITSDVVGDNLYMNVDVSLKGSAS